MVNLGKNWSSSLSNLVSKAIETAQTSELDLRHGAVLFSSMKQVHHSCCNQLGDKICGFDVPNLHAEANCLKPIYNRVSRFGFRHQGRKAKLCERGPYL